MTKKCPIIRAKCPETSEGCPCWHGIVEENAATGEIRETRDCLFRLLPQLMIEVIKASNRPAESLDIARNDINRGLATIASSVQLAARMQAPATKQVKHDG